MSDFFYQMMYHSCLNQSPAGKVAALLANVGFRHLFENSKDYVGYSMVYPPVWRDNPRALASYRRTNHAQTHMQHDTQCRACALRVFRDKGWSDDAMVLGKLPVPGRPTIWMIVGQGPTALAVGAGGVGWTFLVSSILPLFLPLSGRRPDID